jgi:hypothetical protein
LQTHSPDYKSPGLARISLFSIVRTSFASRGYWTLIDAV